MLGQLEQLGFSQKEGRVYLALLEFGQQPASVIAKKVNLPRPTVLFLFDHLVQQGYLRRAHKGRVQYFYAEPLDLQKAKLDQIQKQQELINKTIPLLKEFKSPYTSPPKLTFFEGINGCRKAYLFLLESKTEIYEFAAHDDLLKMGEKFMNGFIQKRARKGILIRTICQDTAIHQYFKKFNRKQKRELWIFPKGKGKLYSSLAVYEDKLLLLNLYHDAFAILIQNKEVAETLKTIHQLVWKK